LSRSSKLIQLLVFHLFIGVVRRLLHSMVDTLETAGQHALWKSRGDDPDGARDGIGFG
jgi:hypothetical protein